jgi:plastocyanin
MVMAGTTIVGLSLFLAACNNATTPVEPPATGTTPVTPPGTTTGPQTISIVGLAYSQKTLTIKVDTEVTIQASAEHPLAGIDEGNSSPIPTAQTVTDLKLKFTKAGTYKYKCVFHNFAGMNGTIIVTN